ncbi:MAG: 4-hydroxythreonine-4-phosphate dehydrogenase PdxA [Vicingaceae bacterium]
MVKKKNSKVKIGISVGDLNGVGMEIILKTIEDSRICELCTPIIYGSKKLTNYYSKALNLSNLSLNYFSSVDEVKGKKPNILNVWEEEVNIQAGEESQESGRYAYLSLQAASQDLKEGKIDALVTAPINKKAIQSADFDFPGHTEYLQELDEAEDSLMLMLSSESRIGVVTGHIPLKEIANTLTTDLILKKINLLNKSLKEDFAIRKPKIAILGLNPHAGENGMLGAEEKEIIEPAIKQAKSIDTLAFGPFPADGFFAASKHRNYDGILAMYHDQGLIPAKLFSVGMGVNFTAGLSFVRTSPDHGTAFEVAGQGVANESSFRSALYHAIDIVKCRQLKEKLEENPLVVNKNRN